LASGPWDDILVGGKDGLFVVIMTLSWWILSGAQGEGSDSQLEEAVADVSWVLSNLVSVLSGRGRPAPSSSVSRSVSAGRSQRPPLLAVKIGPPKKRARLHKP
jgi:hypothetical protein